jgi:hypothetical protein
MKIIISLDELCDRCGYFTSETDANNGYGCNHPKQEEFEMLHKDKQEYTHRGCPPSKSTFKQGKCYAETCPLAVVCSPEHIEEWNKIDKELTEDDLSDYDMMLVDDILIK